MTAISYKCPNCGGTDLRIEGAVVLEMDGKGDLTLESFAALPQSVFELSAPGLVMCNDEDCEHEGKLHEFIEPPAAA